MTESFIHGRRCRSSITSPHSCRWPTASGFHATGRRIPGLDDARVALDIARHAIAVEIVEGEPAMPAERFAEHRDMPARIRMIDAHARCGAPPDAAAALHARVDRHQTPHVE
jgi:hypothetical protein